MTTGQRAYPDWEHDARTTTKSVTRLGNELRDHWDTWKEDAPYKTFDECILAELGITGDALRHRNTYNRKQAERKTSVHHEKPHGEPPPQPKRIEYGTPAEISRRRDLAASLWREGWTREPIAEALRVGPNTTQRDLLAAGCEGRRAKIIPKGNTPEGDFRWRNKDLGITDEESIIEQPSFAACETPSATEAIEDVRIQLALILGGRYRLSLKDRNNLITVLNNALERLHNANQEPEGSRQRNRVAG